MKPLRYAFLRYREAFMQEALDEIPEAVNCLVLQAKKSLLDKFVEEVAGKDAESLRRLLGENEEVMQRREACSKRLDLLQTAYRELTVSLSSRSS